MKIAVFLPNWIGDVVMATPAVRALREHFVGAHIVGVMKPYVAGVVEGLPWFDSLVFLDSSGARENRWPGAAAKLRREGIDVAVLFPNSFRSALVACLGRCKRRIGYARYARSLLLTDALPPIRGRWGRLIPSPVIDAYNELVEPLDCPPPGHRMALATTNRDEAAADRVWEDAGLDRHSEVVCLNPGAAFGAAKHWPVEHFVRLAQDLIDRRGSGVLVLCGPSERELARQIATQARRPGVHSLANTPLSLGLTKACVRRADLLITTDSGPRHFAAAFDRPVVTLFGPTHIAWTETYYRRAVHMQKPVPCGPCQRRVCPLDHRCMKTLTAGEVYAAAVDLLTPAIRRSA
ncbi:MAG: lipopolysaccharide heptosyltransferase II [Gemmataceae bacterium]|nr:lipopolysaccharide heptosyltransferase II [Gemmataceae bacterium]